MANSVDDQIRTWLESMATERPWRKRWAKRTITDEDFDFTLREMCCDYEQVKASDLLPFLEGLRQEYTATRRTRRGLTTAGAKLRRAQDALEGSTDYPMGPVSEEIRRARRKALEPNDYRSTEEEIAACYADLVEYLKRRRLKWTASNKYGWVLLRAVFGKTWRAGWGKDQIRAFFRLRAEPPLGRVNNRRDFERLMRTVKIHMARMESKKAR
jgi:hypothetical protein